MTKAATARSFSMHLWADGSRRSKPEVGQVDPFGLQFLENSASGSDIRLNWKGASLLSRTAHSAIVKVRYVQQTGYYATLWHAYDDGTFHASRYEYGAHPYPADGAVDGTGQATGGTSSSGTVHYYEIAGLGASDFLATAGGSSKIVTKDVWVTHFRKCEVISGTTLRHTFYPDILNDASFSIVQDFALAELPDPGSAAAFILGSSPWTSSNWAGSGSGYTNSECPYGVIRGIKLFSAALSLADAQSEAASGTNSPVTSAGISSVWYMNESPTPSDVTDKSGAGHSPSWANANRPTLWTG